MPKDLQDDEVEHTSSLQRWEVASESNALPCQGSYFRLRSLFCDLLTGFLFYFEKKKKRKGKRPRLKIAVKHSPTGQPVLQENFPGNIKLQLQPQKHWLRNGTLRSDYSGKNLFWVTTTPAWALLISYLVVQVMTCGRKIWFPSGNAQRVDSEHRKLDSLPLCFPLSWRTAIAALPGSQPKDRW